jgi:hypothetical protein
LRRWIEALATGGVVTGCGGGTYAPTADDCLENLAVYLAVTLKIFLSGF